MNTVIGYVLVALALLGLVYTVGLLISFILLPKEETLDLYCCDDCDNLGSDEFGDKEHWAKWDKKFAEVRKKNR